MPATLSIDAFLAQCPATPVLDVRSPAEYVKGHIPGAQNLPLFSDAERAQIGTLYKRQGRHAAILEGLDLIGPRLRSLAERALAQLPGRRALVHCWRGGMRSQSVAWLLEQAGVEVATLAGGYKAFRAHMRHHLATPRPLHVLGGMTGTGKTDVLGALTAAGMQCIDLEALACHRGSVFGAVPGGQPSQEHFENTLGYAWYRSTPDRPVWIEDESRHIGSLHLPAPLWAQMQAAPLFVITLPLEARITRLVHEYRSTGAEALQAAARRLERRLGGLRTREVVEAIAADDARTACKLLLGYYDRTYTHALASRSAGPVHTLSPEVAAFPASAVDLLDELARNAIP